MGYRVDLGLLASKIGITDKPHRMTIRRQVMASFAGRRHGGKDVSIAISNLLIGPPYAANHTPEASHLGYALEALCDAFGTSLFNNPVSPFRGGFLEDVDNHLKANGVEMVSALVYGGAPLGVPRAGEFPMIGHLTLERVRELSELLGGKDLKASTGVLERADVDRHGVIEASEMFRDWVDEALAHKQGLVAFFY